MRQTPNGPGWSPGYRTCSPHHHPARCQSIHQFCHSNTLSKCPLHAELRVYHGDGTNTRVPVLRELADQQDGQTKQQQQQEEEARQQLSTAKEIVEKASEKVSRVDVGVDNMRLEA